MPTVATSITDLRTQRLALATEANTLRARTDRSAEDETRYSAVLDELVRVDENIEREERFLESERRDAEFMRRQGGPGPASDPEPAPRTGVTVIDGMEMRAQRGYISEFGADGRRDQGDIGVYSDPAARAWFRELRNEGIGNATRRFESRAFQADSDVEGGYLSRGEQFVARLIQAVDDQVFMRQLATVMPVEAGFTSLGVPTLDTDAEDTDWTVELGTGNEEDSIRFGKRSLTPHPLAKRVKLSRELLRAAALDPEGIVISRIAYKSGITKEKGYLTGSGAQQPLGVFTASDDGVPTSRDVSTGNTATALTFDGLIENKYNLKGQYWARARWLFHRDAVKQISKLKDGDGQYIWRPSVREGEPDTILGHGMSVSEYVPNTFTTGLYVGMFGDFSHYWIADSLGMTLQRLVELYAETNQIGFILREQSDGMPVLAEAFSRVTLA